MVRRSPLPVLLTAAALLAALCLIPATADAQAPGAYPPPPPPGDYAAPPPPPGAFPAPPMAVPAWKRRWGIGIRAGGATITSTANEDHTTELSSGGLQMRYRFGPRWGIELAVEELKGERDESIYERTTSMASLSLQYHMTPFAAFDWYALFGLGTANDEVTSAVGPNTITTEEFKEHHVHVGLGLERRFERIGIGGELRLFAFGRDDNELDAVHYPEHDGPIPYESSGAQLNLHATLYF